MLNVLFTVLSSQSVLSLNITWRQKRWSMNLFVYQVFPKLIRFKGKNTDMSMNI
jgi:hypothetical protein